MTVGAAAANSGGASRALAGWKLGAPVIGNLTVSTNTSAPFFSASAT